jgi:hypothetical protein
MLYLLKGERKKIDVSPNLLIQPIKNLVHPFIVRVITFEICFLNTIFSPTTSDTQVSYSILKNLKLCDCIKLVTT